MSTIEFLFSAGNAFVLPCWALLIFFPNSKLTRFLFEDSRFSPALVLAVFYAFSVVPALLLNPDALAVLARPTLNGVQVLLSSEQGAAAGWIHYLCFDLLIGITIWKTARKKHQSFLWVSPVLVLVLMLGPLGWLIHQGGSSISRARAGTSKEFKI
jgi:hypothetical protein